MHSLLRKRKLRKALSYLDKDEKEEEDGKRK